jgi:electron transport complex protein RnfB
MCTGSLDDMTVHESRITNHESRPLADAIDALLPQTQCTKCGYPACRPYAEAIARGEAGINQCPPGGAAVIGKLAELLGRPVEPLNAAQGVEEPRMAALIDEDNCIGCTLCIQACPMDAIVGAAKQMHTVLTAQCTGCGLCLPPCPVDCIEMLALVRLAQRGSAQAQADETMPVAQHALRWRARYEWHRLRGSRRREGPLAHTGNREETSPPAITPMERQPDQRQRRAAVEAALARARARRAALAQ